MPTVSYLQRLGAEHLDQIFGHSRWVFEHDRDIAFEVFLDHSSPPNTADNAIQIFTSEEAELPKESVADFLEQLDPAICARYIEFLVAERGETSQQFHDRLADLYLDMTVSAKRRGDDGECDWYAPRTGS